MVVKELNAVFVKHLNLIYRVSPFIWAAMSKYQIGLPANGTHLWLIVPEAGSPRLGCQHGLGALFRVLGC